MIRWNAFGLLVMCAVAVSGCGDDDAGPADSGVGDAIVVIDGAPPCDTNEMCDDGVFCNGEEVCNDGQCVFGPRRDCNDNVLCTVDVCAESAQVCRNIAPDLDGDGHADVSCVDRDGDALGDDCDDTNASRFPGNREVCDPNDVDEDCDDSTYGSLDQDGDNVDSNRCCNVSSTNPDNKTCGTDCNDLRSSIRPGAAEICDKLDNDCDDAIDEGATIPLYVDADRDGHGAEGTDPIQACAGSVGLSPDDDDCDDIKPTVHRAQLEICDNGVDNDCDGTSDEEENDVAWYVDDDGDGFGDPLQPAIASCVPPMGRSILRSDCNDNNGEINPSAPEQCDAIDNDCNGLADFVFGTGNLEDDDDDGSADFACGGADCDDDDATTGNGVEICDGYDNDCDDAIDENVPNTVWYLDRDGDGFGDTSAPALVLCAPISGRTPFGGDCNDSDPGTFPNAKEVCNGRDDNCDGVIDGTPELIDAGCVGSSVRVSGRVYTTGAPTIAGRLAGQGIGSGRPNKPNGINQNGSVTEALITVFHHTGEVVATSITNANGEFSLLVPSGAVFVMVEPPADLADVLVGSAIPVQGPRSDIEVLLHTVDDLAVLDPSMLDASGVLIANITGARPAGGQGVVFDPAVPAVARLGLSTAVPGTVLPPLVLGTRADPLPFAMISAIDVPPGAYLITPQDGTRCRITEGNFYGNRTVYAQQWPVRPNVITWVPVDCSSGLAAGNGSNNCCSPHGNSGCQNTDVSDCVTQSDSSCGANWDESCVHRVTTLGCSTCPSTSSCFVAHPGVGCDVPAIQACVCDDPEVGEPDCCGVSWNSDCVASASSFCLPSQR